MVKISINNFNETTKPIEAVVSHKDQTINWSLSVYTRKSVDSEDIFNEINAYYATLTENEQAVIFDKYRHIKEILDTVTNKRPTIEINKYCIELLNHHNFEKVKEWLKLYTNINIPNSLEENFIEDFDKKTTRDKTYLKEEYVELVTLTVILKCMFPIWGEFMNRIRRNAQRDRKEDEAYQLINNSNLVNTKAFHKLERYVENTLANDEDHNLAVVLKGISTADYPAYITALTVVRKLAPSQINFTDDRVNLMTSIYKFIRQRDRPQDNPSSPVKTKNRGGDDEDMTDKLSQLERYKLKQRISIGDIVGVEYAIEDVENVAFRLHSKIDVNFLHECINSSKELFHTRLLDPQITLLSWVIKPVISPRSIVYLPKEKVVELLGMTQAILWARGHQQLALIATATADMNNEVLNFTDLEAKDKIPKNIVDILDGFYLHRRSSNKQVDFKPVNQAILAIDRLTEDLNKIRWIMTANQWMIEEVYGKNYCSRNLIIPRNIKILLSYCVTQMATRAF